MVTINVNEVFRNKVILGYKNAICQQNVHVWGTCNFTRVKKIGAWSNTAMTDHALLFHRSARERHKHVANSSPVNISQFACNFSQRMLLRHCGTAEKIRRFSRKEFVHKRVYSRSKIQRRCKYCGQTHLHSTQLVLHNVFFLFF